MHHRAPMLAGLLAMALGATTSSVRAFDESRYPDWKGRWVRTDTGVPRYDPSKPPGPGQQAPLNAEYQSVFQASLDDLAKGGHGNDPTYTCIAPGMPRIMNNYEGAEFVITPASTHVLMEHIYDLRRIFTDGRPWPQDIYPSFAGYSIGKWIDRGGTGRYDELDIETRGFKGPRAYDSSGLPLHADSESIITERLFQDAANPDILHDEITTLDHALTRPWTAIKSYRRLAVARPVWRESICAASSPYVDIGQQGYMLSADGYLMPMKKDQPPPDLHFFKSSTK
ncbi:MAG TPA: hypothetical protein VH684_03515 [Xanthobacteraceae bacterium]|jgi:hypothetical protein